jgi:hypothetical protein
MVSFFLVLGQFLFCVVSLYHTWRYDHDEDIWRRVQNHEVPLYVLRVQSKTKIFRRIASTEMLRRVALTRTDVSEEYFASIIRVIRIDELGRTLAVTSKRSPLRSVLRLLVTANVGSSSPSLVFLLLKAIRSTETSVFIRATLHNFTEYGTLHSHRRENLRSYIALSGWAL